MSYNAHSVTPFSVRKVSFFDIDLVQVEKQLEGRRITAQRAEKRNMTVKEYLDHINRFRRAKALAATLDLAYWPALLESHECDPVAFKIAEAVLEKKHGLWNPPVQQRGGWDSMGYHGLSPQDVAQMWYAAGCKDSPKFRAQVSSGIKAKKGDTAPFFRNFIRGCRWINNNRINCYLSRNAVATLGRLSPELRRAALQGLSDWDKNTPIRIRDLNWQAVKRAQQALKSGAIKVRAALAGQRRAASLLGVKVEEVPAALTPQYPLLPLEVAQRIVLGESPASISGLSKKEAHQWALKGAPELSEFLADLLAVPKHRSVKVVRWLGHCKASGRWNAVERERQANIPGEGVRVYSLLSVLDEVQDEDITSGKDSVDVVLQRTAQRLGEAWMSRQMGDHHPLCALPDWAVKLPKGVRFIRTPNDLALEGRDMSHCVGGYINPVEKGQCFILAVQTRHGRSTVELTPKLQVRQHKGVKNAEPPARNERLINALIKRITGEKA